MADYIRDILDKQWTLYIWTVKKFPEWWYCTLMVGHTAYGITFKVGPSSARTHTKTCSIDPAIAGSTDGRLLLESSGVRPSHSI
jgi:hypothetical protein